MKLFSSLRNKVSQLLALLMLLGAGYCVQAEPLYQFHTLTKDDGLSSSVVYDIAQDKNGFVWFATEDGLQKYDGYELETFRHNKQVSGSISQNTIRNLLIDKSGILWIATSNGLDIYDRESNKFSKFRSKDGTTLNSQDIRSIYQTLDGTIWVGTASGLNAISPALDTIKSFPHHKVRAIFEDDHRQLWIGTLRGGLYLFNRVENRFVSIAKSVNEGTEKVNLSGLSIVDIFQDSFKRIFIATWGEGVFQVKRDVRKLLKVNLNLPSKYVRSINQDHSGQIWFGTKEGVLVVNQSENRERTILADHRNKRSLVEDNVLKVFQGNDKTIWVGTYGGGVSRYFPSSQRFETFGVHPLSNQGLLDPVVYSFHENQDGNIWIGSESSKLALFKTFAKQFDYYPLIFRGEEINSEIRALYQLDQKTLLVGTSHGMFIFDIDKRGLTRFSIDNDEILTGDFPIMFIQQDYENRIWVGADGLGVGVYQRSKENTLIPIEGLRISSKFPRAVSHRKGGSTAYVAQGEELRLLTIENEGSTAAFHVTNIAGTKEFFITDVDFDVKGRIWLGTWSDGVKVITSSGKILTIDENKGLLNNSIYSVVSAPNSSSVWVSSNQGVTSINVTTLELTNFTSKDGLQGNEFNLPGIRASNGYIYFGGLNGFNRFFPSVNKEKLFVKSPSLVDLYIANRKVEVGLDSVLSQSLITTKQIKLSFDQTPFSFDFTSPQFVRPEELKFRYRLLGLSDKWIISDASERKATYTNIGAGDYTFELQVGTSQGSWNESIQRLEVQILPPWWKTNLAYTVYTLILSLFVGVSILIWNRKRISEKQIQLAIQENEERLKLSLWGSGYEFWDWNLASGQVSRSNQFNKIQIDCDFMGTNLNELASYIHPNDLMMVKEKLTNHIAGNNKHFDVCYRIIDSKRGWRWIQDRGKVVSYDQSGTPLRMSGTQRDITDMREKEAQFEMLGQAFKSTSDGVWIRDHEWKLVECNPAYERITGFSLSEKKGEVLWFPEIQEQPENLLQRIRISIDEKGSWQGEAWAERKNNDPFPQKLSIDTLHDEKGNVRYYVGVFSDITFHKRTEEEFRKLANYDSLTGLPNRACLYDRLNQTIEKTKRDQGRFALFLIDVDNFKRINDSLGHSVGDILIRQVASRLVNCNKEGDTVARIGGDEFVIVMEKVRSSTSVAAFAELLLHELNQPIFIKGEQLKLNFSVGVTLAPDDAIIAERLMRNADTAMYEAKKSIDNSYRFFSVEFNERARKRLELENALRKAIEDDAIDLHYQPKVDLTAGRVKGVEALARWTHRELGFVSPDEFIPLAEETGLILPLGEKILLKAIKQTKYWVDKGVMRGRTSVNLSAHQFWNKNLAGEILNLLDEYELDAKYIELEITESACMQDTEETKNQIEQLKSIGISLALDDFGTGYSSLAQLKSLPFDTLKVDKSFVDNIETNRQDEKVVKAIIDIAKTMEMEVVIEGVESKSQCKYLWKNRAYVVQGYFFSKPVKSDQIERLFEAEWHKKDYLGKFISNVTPLV